MKTFTPTPKDIQRDWFVVDASNKTLGRLASQIAHRLRGKHKPIFTPHMDTGDFIVVTNVEKLRVTGTPTIFFTDGSRIPGAIDAKGLEAKLASVK